MLSGMMAASAFLVQPSLRPAALHPPATSRAMPPLLCADGSSDGAAPLRVDALVVGAGISGSTLAHNLYVWISESACRGGKKFFF